MPTRTAPINEISTSPAPRHQENATTTPTATAQHILSTPTHDIALLTIEQAAAHLNVSARYVRRLVAERRITFYRLGRCVRFRPTDLDAHINAGRVEPLTRAAVWNDLRSVA